MENCTHLDPVWRENIDIGAYALCHFQGRNKSACLPSVCRLALQCHRSLSVSDTNTSAASLCPTFFDGWSCVPSANSDNSSWFPCPDWPHFGYTSANSVHRRCSADGWDFFNTSSPPYLPYVSCFDSSLKLYESVTNVYIAGYATSLLFLLAGLLIFVSFPALRCGRNTVHAHLFASFSVSNVCWLLWYSLVDSDIEVQLSSPEWCKALHVFLWFTTTTTYTWMLCEGLYLYLIVVITFVSERRVLACLYLLGWILPLLLILSYFTARLTSSDPELHLYCYKVDTSFNWIYKGPCITSILLNIIFLIRVILVVQKLGQSDHSQFRVTRTGSYVSVKTVKAVCVLIPLFGLQFLVVAFTPEKHSTVKLVLEFLKAILTSFQGLVVAILFCFLNNEVTNQLTKFYRSRNGTTSAPRRGQSTTRYTFVRSTVPNNCTNS